MLVTGSDHWSWTAYAFVDTYYKDAKGQDHTQDQPTDDDLPWNHESPAYYHQQAGQISLDPLTGGQHETEPPVWRPREYFLKVLRSRVWQVNHEWHNTVFRVLQRIEPYVRNGCPLPKAMPHEVGALQAELFR